MQAEIFSSANFSLNLSLIVFIFITCAGRQLVEEWASFFFGVSQIYTASSKRDAAQGYIYKAEVAWLCMWDLIFPFVILKL